MNQTQNETLWSVDRSSRGKLVIVGCTSAHYLLRSIINQINVSSQADSRQNQVPYLEDIDFRFSDSEIGVRLDMDVSGCDIFLLQALYDPNRHNSVSENFLALCIAARTFLEWGAHKVTALLPYLTYARQDKPTRFKREPTTARLIADLLITSGIDQVVTWHPHYQQIHGFYGGIPVEVLEPLNYFIDLFKEYRSQSNVILVAPDIGASKFTTHLGRALDLQVAIAAKYHPEREQTEISQIIGDMRNKDTAIVVDDMMSSGGTLYSVVKLLVETYNMQRIILAVSHNLCTEQAYNRLLELHEHYHLQKLYVTNSIPQTKEFEQLGFTIVRDLTDDFVRVIGSIHSNRY